MKASFTVIIVENPRDNLLPAGTSKETLFWIIVRKNQKNKDIRRLSHTQYGKALKQESVILQQLFSL
jgi:hypothetical protein